MCERLATPMKTNSISHVDRAAYLDSSAIVALAVPSDMHHDGTVRVCRAAVRNGYFLITSLLAIMESIAAIRKKITMSSKCRSSSEKELAQVKARAGMAVSYMFRIVDMMVDLDHLKIVDLDGWSPSLPVLCHEMIRREGSVTYNAKSRTCRHRGVGSHDLLHYSIVKHLGAPVIITSDAAFADIEGSDGGFGHIRIQLTGGPLIDLLSDGT